MVRSAVVLLLLSLSACASTPEPGDPCGAEGTLTCTPPPGGCDLPGCVNLAVECRGGVQQRVHCRGQDGCEVTKVAVECDPDRVVAGDGCWMAQYAGKDACEYQQPNFKVVCTNGVWERQPCSGCRYEPGQGIRCF